MLDKKVKVLLSSYNGEKYIGQQIDSILEQTYKNIEIYVRDDGSSDKTINILKNYEEKGLIYLEKGNNIGFINSFFALLKNCGEADYFAYCDQDDVWKPDKIQMALWQLEKRDASKPLLYFSDYDFYDSDLNFLERVKSYKHPPSFRNSITDCMALGFNSVFNLTAKSNIVENIPKHSCGHDWWTYMVCVGLGEVIYDKQSTVKYRRHGSNTSAGGMSFIEFQIWRFKKFFINDYFKNIHLQIKEFERLFGGRLSVENYKVLKLFTEDNYNPVTVAKKMFFMKPFRQRGLDELMLRIIFLMGKL